MTTSKTSGRAGRPRLYPEGSNPHGKGAPNFTLRLEPELLAYVREQGGAPWLRELIETYRAAARDEGGKA